MRNSAVVCKFPNTVSAVFAAVTAVFCCLIAPESAGATWSIVAIDRKSSDVGVAIASCIGSSVGLIGVDPAHGAVVVQALYEPRNLRRAFRLLHAGASAEQILGGMTRRSWDEHPELRQYGVATFDDGAAAFTGKKNQRWAGDRQGRGVTAQGNILVGRSVPEKALDAFGVDSEDRSLSDRLMDALIAGSIAGGDRRCNVDGVRQTAASAAIIVARRNDDAYTPLMQNERAHRPWLRLSAIDLKTRKNAVHLLALRYQTWREQQLESAPNWAPPSNLPRGNARAERVAQTPAEARRAGVLRFSVIVLVAVIIAGFPWIAMWWWQRRRKS